jgi:hypothetical protein
MPVRGERLLGYVIPSSRRWLKLRLLGAVLGTIGFMLLATLGLVPNATTAASGGGCGDFVTFPFGTAAACISAHFFEVHADAQTRFSTPNRDVACLIWVAVLRDDPQSTPVRSQQFHCPTVAGVSGLALEPFFGGLRGVYRTQFTIVGTGFKVTTFSPWMHEA